MTGISENKNIEDLPAIMGSSSGFNVVTVLTKEFSLVLRNAKGSSGSRAQLLPKF